MRLYTGRPFKIQRDRPRLRRIHTTEPVERFVSVKLRFWNTRMAPLLCRGLIALTVTMTCPIGTELLAQAHSGSENSLCIAERASYRLPRDYSLRGARFDPAVGSVTWSADSSIVMFRKASSATERRIELPGRPVNGAIRPNGTLEFITTVDSSLVVVRTDGEGTITDTRAYAPVRPLAGAAFQANQWILATTAPNEREGTLKVHNLAGAVIEEAPIPKAVLSGASPILYIEPGVDSTVIITFSSQPYPMYRYDLQSRSLKRMLSVADSVLEDIAGTATSGIMALKAMDLDNGLLRQFVDLKSDRRFFLLVKSYGGQVEARMQTTRAPLAFVDVHLDSSTLLGSREVEEQELVTYGWSWDRAPCEANAGGTRTQEGE